jgi:hypothetical protein
MNFRKKKPIAFAKMPGSDKGGADLAVELALLQRAGLIEFVNDEDGEISLQMKVTYEEGVALLASEDVQKQIDDDREKILTALKEEGLEI